MREPNRCTGQLHGVPQGEPCRGPTLLAKLCPHLSSHILGACSGYRSSTQENRRKRQLRDMCTSGESKWVPWKAWSPPALQPTTSASRSMGSVLLACHHISRPRSHRQTWHTRPPLSYHGSDQDSLGAESLGWALEQFGSTPSVLPQS